MQELEEAKLEAQIRQDHSEIDILANELRQQEGRIATLNQKRAKRCLKVSFMLLVLSAVVAANSRLCAVKLQGEERVKWKKAQVLIRNGFSGHGCRFIVR